MFACYRKPLYSGRSVSLRGVLRNILNAESAFAIARQLLRAEWSKLPVQPAQTQRGHRNYSRSLSVSLVLVEFVCYRIVVCILIRCFCTYLLSGYEDITTIRCRLRPGDG